MHNSNYSFMGSIRWVLLAFLLFVPPSYAWERDDRLAIMASDLLPAILAAQDSFHEFYFSSLSDNSITPTLTINVIYRKKRYLAEQAVKRINSFKLVKGTQLKAQAVSLKAFMRTRKEHGITSKAEGSGNQAFNRNEDGAHITFIIEDLGKQLNSLLEYTHKDLTYSSSTKDVKEGVAVGISVTEMVLPVVNLQALSKINIKFSSLFMRIVKRVE